MTLLAVAMTNTGDDFSCSQVTKLPNTRAVVPASEKLELCVPRAPFQLIQPQDRGRHRLGGLDRLAHIFLGRPHQAGKDFADIQPQQW